MFQRTETNLAKQTAFILHLVAASSFLTWVIFLGCTRRDLVALLGVSAVAEFAAVAFDKIKERRDEADAKVREGEMDTTRTELEATKAIADELAEKAKDRRITGSAKIAWKESLADHQGQLFAVIQLGNLDHEAAAFARDISDVLKECDWEGESRISFPFQNFRIKRGIAVGICGLETGGVWPAKTAEAIGKILGLIRSHKFEESAAYIDPKFFPFSTIVIVVGPKT